jgi:hypothetical protein
MGMPPPKTEILLALLLLLCAPATAAAQGTDDYPANRCRSGLFPSDDAGFKPAKVGGNWTARVHFFNDDDCPLYEAKCETKRYLVTGDQVLVSRTYGRWVCGWYQPRKGGETVGWLLADKLVVSEPPARPATANWVGSWKYAGKSLDIRRGEAGLLKVKGHAVWEGAGANARVGGVEAEARPRR